MKKSVRLADIAKILGVSVVTVSKALSDQKGVSDEMRGRIKELADKMGYVQPSLMRRQASGKSYNIGVLVSERYLNSHDSFYWELYQCVVKKAAQKKCFTMLEVLNDEEENAALGPKLLQEHKVDGLVILGVLKENYLKKISDKAQVPYVYLDFYDEKHTGDAVISNGYFGSYMMTNYLFDMGHMKIAYVGTLLYSKSITDRYFGYAKSLLEHGQNIRDEWVIPDRDMETGVIGFKGKLEKLEQMPTAFVCNCDLTAGFLINELEAQGYRVPDDFSVVGFDNYLYPGICDVKVTTYEVDIREMSRRTINNLLKKIEGEREKQEIAIVDGHPVYKDSVKRL